MKRRIHGKMANTPASTGQPVVQESTIVQHSRTGADKLASKENTKPTSYPLPSSSTENIPIHVTQKDAQRFPISKRMIALLRHGTLPRDEDGAIEIWRSKEEFKSAVPNSVHWPIRLWTGHLQKKAEDIRRYFSFARIILRHKFFTSELSKVIRERILWIHLYWTTC